MEAYPRLSGSPASRPLPRRMDALCMCVTATAHTGSVKNRNDGYDWLALSGPGSTGWERKDFTVFWPLGQGRVARGAKLVPQTTEGQFPSENIKTYTNELNISNKMTLLKTLFNQEGKTSRPVLALPVAYGTEKSCFFGTQSFPEKEKYQGENQRRRSREVRQEGQREGWGRRGLFSGHRGTENWRGAN